MPEPRKPGEPFRRPLPRRAGKVKWRQPRDSYLATYFRPVRMRAYMQALRKHQIGGISREELWKIKAMYRDPSNATPWIKLFSKENFKFRGGIPTEQETRNVLDWLSRNIQFVEERPVAAEFMYGKQTAEDVLWSKRIPAVFDHKEPAWGCGVVADTLIALLKTFPGVESIKHVRTTTLTGAPHSVVYFELPLFATIEGRKETIMKRFIADPFHFGSCFLGGSPGRPIMLEMVGQVLGARIKELKAHGQWAEGNSLLDFNKSFADYKDELRRRSTGR